MNEIKNQPKALHSRYIKKPVTVEAIQWTGDNLRDVISFTNGPPYDRSDHAGMSWEDYCELVARDGLKIFTLEGKMNASVGDWIIRGIKGELYPCKPDIFEETYVPAPATQSDTYRCQAPQGYVRPQEPDSHDGHDYEGFIGGCQRMGCKASVADVVMVIPTSTSATMSDEQIKAVFLANGFTIKEGMTDLKPYVYQAARALLATGGQVQPVASIYVTEDGQREVDDWRVPLPAGSNLLYTAPQAVQAAAVPEAIEQMAADRYKVVPSHESMFHRWAVVADDGAQQLYIGREGECQNMARKFMGAFLDGAFVAMQNAAPALHSVGLNEWLGLNKGKHYEGLD